MTESGWSQQLTQLQRQLNSLEMRAADSVGEPPLELVTRIEYLRQAILLTRQVINGELTDDAYKSALKPLQGTLQPPTDAHNIRVRDVAGDVVAGDKVLGDSIAGDKIEVNKNFVRVVFRGIPVWVLLLIPIVVVAIASVAWLQFVPDKMPLNTFNVAVAEFGQVDAQGNVSPSKDGKNLSKWMYGQLKTEYKNWPSGQPTVWHDSQSILAKRANIGIISGDTPAARRDSAKAIADQIGANMVIYGNLAIGENPVRFIPEFYVAAISSEADEIVGEHQLGTPIDVRLPINLHDDRTSTFFEDKLGIRVDALVWFTRGLALDLSGRHQDAMDIFQTAETELKNWDDNQGKNILYYFIGREALSLSNKDLYPDSDFDTAELLLQAEKAFSSAIEIDPQYTRGHIGLGGVYFQRAQYLLSPEQRLQTEDLNSAILHYSLSISNAVQTADIPTEIKGRFGLGISYSLQGDTYLRATDIEHAKHDYDRAIEEIEHALILLDDDQHRLSAQAYLGLGGAYEGRAYIAQFVDKNQAESRPMYENAHAAYLHCIEQADEEFYDSFLQELKMVYCEPYSQEVQAILDSL